MFQLLLLMALSQFSNAGVITAPTAGITPPPLVRREVTTAGYRSTGYSDGTTLWGAVTINLEDQIIATSGSLYRLCKPGTQCDFFTCSGDSVVYPSATSEAQYCGTSIGSTCSYDVSYTDLNDLDPKTNYWCDSQTLDGWDIYAITPDAGESSTSSDTTTTSPTTTTTSSSSSTSPTPGGQSAGAVDVPGKKKSVPIGPIIGGVIGGIAVIGLIVVAAIILLKRNKKTPPQPPVQQQSTPAQYYNPNPYQQQPPMGQMPMGAPVGVATIPEKAPVATTQQANPYYATGEAGPMSPVPQYSTNNGAVNELPATRM